MRRIRIFALLGMTWVVCLPQVRASSQYRHYLEASRYYSFGSQELRRGNVARARTYFTKALRIYPVMPEAHLGLGHIAMTEHRFLDALQEYDSARDGYAGVGASMYDLRAERFAMSQDEISRLRDEIRTVQRLAASGKIRQSSADQQISQFEAAIQRLDSTEPPGRDRPMEVPGEVHFHLGNALFRLDRLEEAIQAWETCTQKSPEHAAAHNNLAVAYWRAGRIEAATASLAKATALGLQVSPDFQKDLQRVASTPETQHAR